MELVRLDSLSSPGSPGPVASAVTVGNFDGVHRGHQALVGEMVGWARSAPGDAVVLTFDPHPAQVLSPHQAKRALMTLEQKAEALAALGVDRLVALTFTEEVARMSAEEFARLVLRGSLSAPRVVVGQDFRFGHGRTGDVAALRALGETLGFAVRAVGPVLEAGVPISSSRIRDVLAAGEVAAAGRLLGRPFFVDGPVVRGDGRGRGLGFPTANVAVRNETLPERGVYACQIRLGAKEAARAAVANLGQRPTFGGGQTVLEVHVLDFSGDLYGREVRVSFVERLRPEHTFASKEDLVAQIEADLREARRILVMPR